ncbi:hypothetical protein [Atlantibacter sp.]|nr:hypothetical protein [Atlantibacter sp.]
MLILHDVLFALGAVVSPTLNMPQVQFLAMPNKSRANVVGVSDLCRN